MQINLTKLQNVETRFNAIIGELACQIEKIGKQIKFVRVHEEDSQEIAELKRIKDKLTENMQTVMKLKEAVKRINGIYASGEKRIVRYIDEGPKVKREFKPCTYISDKTDFDWSIK
ncbi:MAG: hypothetical protein IJA62_03955 [Ruminococcus sp.]|nr:hypothetical protein [Ruminococcus sp.]